MNSNRLIAMAAIISFATVGAANLSAKSGQDTGQLPSSREWIGLSIVFLMLSAASDLGIEAAGGMSILVMITILLARGEDAAAYLGVRLATSSGKTPSQLKRIPGSKPTAKRIQNTRKQLHINNPRKPQKPASNLT